MSARDVELALTVQQRPKSVAVAPSPLVITIACMRIFPDFSRKLLSLLLFTPYFPVSFGYFGAILQPGCPKVKLKWWPIAGATFYTGFSHVRYRPPL